MGVLQSPLFPAGSQDSLSPLTATAITMTKMTVPWVLVVDDEPHITDLVTTAFRYDGFDAEQVMSGQAALSSIAADPPDLVVLDVMLPDLDGFEVTCRLRSAGVPVPELFLTARDATEDKISGLTVGGDDYLSKPFSLEELIARARAILRRTSPGDSASETHQLNFP